VGEENNNSPAGETRARRDGDIDFTRYSTDQLIELRDSLDRNAFPLNFEALLRELNGRSADPARGNGSEWRGRFTRRDGLAGWLGAKFRRQPLFGAGSIDLRDTAVVLHGWQRTWLGVKIERALTLPRERIRNVVAIDGATRFEIARRWFAKRVVFRPEDGRSAATLAQMLPQARTRRFERSGISLLEFEERQNTRCPTAWATPAIVILNVLVFVAMVVEARSSGDFTSTPVQFWGANVGPFTLQGQWWRLFSAMFVHGSLAHLVLNMWALWSVGRSTERLLGNWNFLLLYLGSGLLASLSTLLWDPASSSVGASGAIFGVFGAFLACLMSQGARVPVAVLRSHWIPTLLFLAFNLISGAVQPNIDNAAHVGGLAAGFGLGYVLAHRVDNAQARVLGIRAVTMAIMAWVLCAAGVAWCITRNNSHVPVAQQFMAEQRWFVTEEANNLRTWQVLGALSSSGSMSDATLSARIRQEILPFWKSAWPRLQELAKKESGPEHEYLLGVADYAQARANWAQAIVDSVDNRDVKRGEDAARLRRETDHSYARLQRLTLRSVAEQRPAGLKNLTVFHAFRKPLSSSSWNCVKEPYPADVPVAKTDSRSDGPAMREAVGCLAQRYFVQEEFVDLDELLHVQASHLKDLLDGGSSLRASASGLSDLFSYSTFTVDHHMRLLAQWRREVPDSLFPDIVEALMFEDWAWSVRGHGFANEVSAQSWALFAFRNEMAAASLEGILPRALDNPLWQSISMSVSQDRDLGREKLRSLMDDGLRRSPDNSTLYTRMLRALMPRWGGSPGEVREFIDEMTTRAPASEQAALYAELFWRYAELERDDVNIFKETGADWPRMKAGFQELMAQHPKSDYVLNVYARFACLAGDQKEYDRIRPEVMKRPSATAWTFKTTQASCNKRVSIGQESAGAP
jgi:membrane associated rhomboid family serine protease